MDLDGFTQHGYGRVVPNRDLKLVDLTSEGLRRIKVPQR